MRFGVLIVTFFTFISFLYAADITDTPAEDGGTPVQTEVVIPPAEPEKQPSPLLFVKEKQVAFDNAGKIMVLDENLRIRYGILPTLDGFRQALLFEADSGFILAVTLEKGGKEVDERIPLTKEDVQELRNRLQPDLQSSLPVEDAPGQIKTPGFENEKDGLAPFLAYTTVWSGIYGAAFPFIFGGAETHWALYPGISLLSAGLGFAGAYLGARNSEITRGMAFGSAEGAFRGAVDGATLFWLIAGNANFSKDRDQGNSIRMDSETYARLIVGSSVVLSMAEYGLGMWYAKKYNVRGGDMRLLGVGSLVGYGMMMELSGLIFGGLYSSDDSLVRITPAMMLAGGVGGLFLAAAVSKDSRYTEGDTSLLQTGIILGTSFPLSVIFAAKWTDTMLRIYSGLALAGTIGGAIGSHYLLKGLDFTNLDAFLIDLGTVAGGLVGAGIGFLGTMGNLADGIQYIPLAAVLGAGIGFGTMLAVYYDKGKKQAEELDSAQGWSFQLNPAGLAGAIMGPSTVASSDEEVVTLLNRPNSPLVSFEYKF